MDKEKQVRMRIDGKVNQMMAEAAELKQWTISEVSCCSVTYANILYVLHTICEVLHETQASCVLL